MGACQSRTSDHVLQSPSKAREPSKTSSKSRSLSSSSRTKLIITPKHGQSAKSSIFSPSENTDATDPMTPSSLLGTPENLSEMYPTTKLAMERQNLPALDEYAGDSDEDFIPESDEFPLQASRNLGSELSGAVIDSVITEEESLGAPSDEEDTHDDFESKKSSVTLLRDSIPDSGLSKAPPRKQSGFAPCTETESALPIQPQTRVKILSKRITAPESIVHRPSLIAPPQGAEIDLLSSIEKTAVNPQTIANFNRLKIQVQLANRAEEHRRHKEKVKDRYEDVQGYRNLWSDYEDIQDKVKGQEETNTNDASQSLDLKDSASWYFDFRALRAGTLDDNSDNQSQASLSLLSDANLEVQRRLFKQKRKNRKDRKRRERRFSSDERSIGSVNSSASKRSIVFLRGQPAEGDYGPEMQVTVPGTLVDSDDDTPKAGSKAGDDEFSRAGSVYDDSSVISDLDMDNDYNVPRRRRRHHNYAYAQDDQSVSTLGERSLEDLGLSQAELDVMTDLIPVTADFNAPKSVEVKTQTPRSPSRVEKYGFDPSAPLFSQIDLTMPSVQIDNADTGVVTWRKFSTSEEKEVKKFGIAARRLEDLYGAGDSVDDNVEVTKQPATSMLQSSPADDGASGKSSVAECQTLSKDCEKDCVPEQQIAILDPDSESKISLSDSLDSGNEGGTGQSSPIPEEGETYKSKSFVASNEKTCPSKSDDLILKNVQELSSDQFLRFSSFQHYESSACSDGKENQTGPQEHPLKLHSERETHVHRKTDPEKVASNTHSGVLKPSKSSVVNYMSTEAFLMLSTPPTSTDCAKPGHNSSDESKALTDDYHQPPVDVMAPCKPMELDKDNNRIQGLQSSSHSGALVSSDMDLAPGSNAAYLDNCDALANELTAQIDKLLSDFREDSKVQN